MWTPSIIEIGMLCVALACKFQSLYAPDDRSRDHERRVVVPTTVVQSDYWLL